MADDRNRRKSSNNSHSLPPRNRTEDAEGICVAITSDRDIIIARQKGKELAARLGFSNTDLTLIATAISELARNIVVYAGNGEITLRASRQGEKKGIIVIARDEGPGISDITRALQDGFSTSRSLGLGLPGVRRLMDTFDLVSSAAEGTTVTIRKWTVSRGSGW